MRRIIHALVPLFSVALLIAGAAEAAPKIKLDDRQVQLLQAAQHMQKHEFPAALLIYDRLIAANGSDISLYLQRGLARRELKDAPGTRADAQAALKLVEMGLQTTPNNPKLYYHRGMALRLLKDYPRAKENLQYALKMSGNKASWAQDLKAVEIEEKFNP